MEHYADLTPCGYFDHHREFPPGGVVLLAVGLAERKVRFPKKMFSDFGFQISDFSSVA